MKIKYSVYLLFAYTITECSTQAPNMATSNYITFPVNQGYVATGPEVQISKIRIFDQYQDEFLKNNGVIFAYDSSDKIVTDTTKYQTSQFIVANTNTGMFFTIDQVTERLRDPQDPYIYPYMNDKKANPYWGLFHRKLDDNFSNINTKVTNPLPFIYLAVNTSMQYKGIPFNDYTYFILTTLPGTLSDNRSKYLAGGFYDQDINQKTLSPDVGTIDGRNFFLNYTSPKLDANPAFRTILLRRDGSSGPRPVPSTWNHNDFIIYWDYSWFTLEDIFYKLQKGILFNSYYNICSWGFYIYVNVSAWNAPTVLTTTPSK